MLNNKGQSLILFVIVLPILLLVTVLVIDVGRIVVMKQELKSISNIALDYGLDNLEKDNLSDELYNLVQLNNNEIDEIDINIDNNRIYINLNENVNGVFSKIIDISNFDVESSYVGYVLNDEKIIERISR